MDSGSVFCLQIPSLSPVLTSLCDEIAPPTIIPQVALAKVGSQQHRTRPRPHTNDSIMGSLKGIGAQWAKLGASSHVFLGFGESHSRS